MNQICVKINEKDISDIKFFIGIGLFPNVSEAIRIAVKDLIDKYYLTKEIRDEVVKYHKQLKEEL